MLAENLALRQQLAILRRKTPRPRLVPIDRAFWIVLSRLWPRWTDALGIVKPATVIAWHRRGFARFWAWRSRRRFRRHHVQGFVQKPVPLAGRHGSPSPSRGSLHGRA
jgi:hypothetical protein